jgi:hypothetical protein
MSQTVTAAQAPVAIGRIDGHTNYASKDYVVTSGVTINAGDFVYFASGAVLNTTVSGARLVGMAEGTATGNATGTVTVKVCIDRNMQYLLKGATAFATVSNGTSTAVGAYFDLAGTTGAQTITTSSLGATTGQFVCVGIPSTASLPNTGLAGLAANSYAVFVLVSSFINPYVSG